MPFSQVPPPVVALLVVPSVPSVLDVPLPPIPPALELLELVLDVSPVVEPPKPSPPPNAAVVPLPVVELVVEPTVALVGPLELVEFPALVLVVPVVAVVLDETVVAVTEVVVETVSPPSSMGSLLSAESLAQAVRQAQSAKNAPRRTWRLVVESLLVGRCVETGAGAL